jgi:type IV pilus secretin PilQ/predicted competence protein
MRVDSRKLLSVGMLLLISTLAVHGATSKETGIVKDVSFSNSGDSLEAKITASDDSKFTYFELQNPHRLVIDFHGIQNTIKFKEKQIDIAGVERVRTSLFSDRSRKATRIVFDLKGNVPYRIVEDGDGVTRIVFGETARAPENQTAGPVIVPSTLVSRALPPTVLAMIPTSTSPATPASKMPSVQLGSATGQPAAVPQAQPVPVPATSPVVTAAEPGQQTQVTVVPQTSPTVSTTPTPIPQYTGEIATFELVDYPIRDFFRLISELSGLNVFLDPTVNGTVTMTLKDVPWDQALDVVLKNNNLGGQLQGNVLRIASNATLQNEQNQAKALHDAQEAAAPLEVHTYVLNYTKATDVNTTLRGMTTPRGSIVVDPRRNALIVKDVPAQFTQLEAMIKFVDMPQQQVDIEARLLSANKSFSRDIGNQLGLLIGANGGNVLTGLTGQPSPITRNQTLPTGGSNLPLIANFPAAATSGLSFFIKPGGDVLLDEIITAAEAKGTARLISRPHVTTQNNQAATIQQGTQIPVQTNVNNTVTTQFVTFALQLDVTPQIGAAGTILMQVNVTNSQPDFARAVGGIPSVASQSAKTLVMVPDGATAVIGGILVDTDSINIRQVPGLGNLPVIGNLFKETNTAKSTSELLFFITPRIKPIDAISVLAPSDTNSPEQPQRR